MRDLNLGTLETLRLLSPPDGSAPPRVANDDGRLSFRGLTAASNTSRNFFMWYVPSDTYNVERLDFSLGSNSLMFGDPRPVARRPLIPSGRSSAPLPNSTAASPALAPRGCSSM